MNKHINQEKDSPVSLRFLIACAFAIILVGICAACSKDERESSSTEISLETTSVTTAAATTTTTAFETASAPQIELSDEASALLATNPDYIGRIYINGTNIDYPFTQCLDNSYYLETDFFGEYYRYGTVYADYRCNFGADEALQSDNLVLYGHHTALNDYFSQLHYYKKDIEFYKQHPIIEIKSNYKTYYYKIFAYMITNAYEKDGPVFYYHTYHDFDTQQDFDWYVNEVQKRSLIVSDVDVEYGDKLLTLSTCTTEFEDSRFVVYARRLRDGEDEFAGVEASYLNPNPLMPDTYYRIYGGSYIEDYEN